MYEVFGGCYIGGSQEVEKRFLEKVYRPPELEKRDDCWEWTGCKCNGYGHMHIAGKVKKAHRLIFEALFGPISKGLVVMHTCDNRGCVQPQHLRLGTPKDNNADRDAKGRHIALKGEQHGMSKLTNESAEEIFGLKRFIASEVTRLATRHDVTEVTIRNVLRGRTWRWFEPKK